MKKKGGGRKEEKRAKRRTIACSVRVKKNTPCSILDLCEKNANTDDSHLRVVKGKNNDDEWREVSRTEAQFCAHYLNALYYRH